MSDQNNDKLRQSSDLTSDDQVDSSRRRAVGKILEGSALMAAVSTTAVKTVIAPILAVAATPAQAIGTTIPPGACVPGTIYHFDKVIFKVLSDLSGQIPSSLIGSVIDLIIANQVGETTNLDARILDALEKHINDEFGTPVSLDPNQIQLSIIDVRYQAEACDVPPPSTTLYP